MVGSFRERAAWLWRSWPLHLAALVALAAVLRLWTLDDRSLWLDEINVAAPALGGVRTAIETAKAHADATPLDYVIIALSQELFGRGELPVRLPAALFGIGSVIGVYFLGRTLAGHWTGLLGGLLLAISPGHVWYSQEGRFYSLLTFCGVLSTLVLLAAVRRRRAWLWALYALTVAAGLYAGYQFAFVAAIHAGAFAGGALLGWWRAALKDWLSMGAAQAAAGFAFLPWFLWDESSPEYGYEAPPRSAEPVVDHAAWLFSYNAPAVFDNAPVDADWGICILVAVAAGLAALLAWRRKQPLVIVAAAALVTIPFVILFVVRRQEYFMAPRHLVFLLPFAALLIAYAACEMVRLRPFLAPLAGALVLPFILVAAFGLEHESGVPKQEYRETAAYLEARWRPGDRLIAFSYPTIWYYHDFGEVPDDVRTRDDLERYVDLTQGEVWVYTTGREWKIRSFRGHFRVMETEPWEEVDFLGVRLFHRRGGSRIDVP